MTYTETTPELRLQDYISCYYYFESDTPAALEDTVFPGGPMEII